MSVLANSTTKLKAFSPKRWEIWSTSILGMCKRTARLQSKHGFSLMISEGKNNHSSSWGKTILNSSHISIINRRDNWHIVSFNTSSHSRLNVKQNSCICHKITLKSHKEWKAPNYPFTWYFKALEIKRQRGSWNDVRTRTLNTNSSI